VGDQDTKEKCGGRRMTQSGGRGTETEVIPKTLCWQGGQQSSPSYPRAGAAHSSPNSCVHQGRAVPPYQAASDAPGVFQRQPQARVQAIGYDLWMEMNK
jgi:hypothetical protein